MGLPKELAKQVHPMNQFAFNWIPMNQVAFVKKKYNRRRAFFWHQSSNSGFKQSGSGRIYTCESGKDYNFVVWDQ